MEGGWGEEGETKLLLEQNVRERGCGEGDRANTPHISQLKTKPAPACCFVNACPGQRPGVGGGFPLHPHTAEHPRAGHPAPAGTRGAQQCTSDSKAHTHLHTFSLTHTPKHFESINATVIQRQWGGVQKKGDIKKRVKGRKGWNRTGNRASAHRRVGAGARDRADNQIPANQPAVAITKR